MEFEREIEMVRPLLAELPLSLLRTLPEQHTPASVASETKSQQKIRDLAVGLLEGLNSVEEATKHGEGSQGALPYLFLSVSQEEIPKQRSMIFHLRMGIGHLAHTLCTSSLSEHKKCTVNSGFGNIPQSLMV